MAGHVHPTAIIEDGASVGENVRIGPYCLIGARARIDDDVELISHVVIAGNTHIGQATRIFPFASVGHEPQDLKYRGEENRLAVGKNCIIREGVTLNPGTAGDNSETLIGDRCVFLANSHVAHDCIVGEGSILSNNVMLGGHCKVGRNVILGGGAGVHQFCRLGDNCFIGGIAGVGTDVIPYGIAVGNRASLAGLNVVGMRRAGMDSKTVHNARRAYKFLFGSGKTLTDAIASLDDELKADAAVAKIVSFIEESGSRGLCTPDAGATED